MSTLLSITSDSLDEQDELPADSPLLSVWFGFIFAGAFFVGELVVVFLGLEESMAGFVLILVALGGWIYWLVCVHRFHKILREVSRNHYPFSGGEAVGKHFIPFYNLYWLFKWPTTMTDYLSQRGRVQIVSGNVLGAILLISLLTGRFFDGGIGLTGVFAVGMYISSKLRAHLRSISPGELPPAPDPNWFSPAPETPTPQVETDRPPRV
jgi:hypothetical protein